ADDLGDPGRRAARKRRAAGGAERPRPLVRRRPGGGALVQAGHGTSQRDRAIDAGLGLLIFALTVAHLARLPHNLGGFDESFFLYEARRIREGETMYRDFFQFVTPVAWYVMALLYWLFGTTMTTARTGMAVIHGVTAVVLYLTCRTLDIRRPLALLVP